MGFPYVIVALFAFLFGVVVLFEVAAEGRSRLKVFAVMVLGITVVAGGAWLVVDHILAPQRTAPSGGWLEGHGGPR